MMVHGPTATRTRNFRHRREFRVRCYVAERGRRFTVAGVSQWGNLADYRVEWVDPAAPEWLRRLAHSRLGATKDASMAMIRDAWHARRKAT